MYAPAMRQASFEAHPESDVGPVLELGHSGSDGHLYQARSDLDRHQSLTIDHSSACRSCTDLLTARLQVVTILGGSRHLGMLGRPITRA